IGYYTASEAEAARLLKTMPRCECLRGVRVAAVPHFERGHLVALRTQLRHEGLGDPDPSTGFGDIFQDVEQVGSDGGEKRHSPHAERPFALSSALLAARAASSSSSETSPPAAIEA